ncbi:MAG: phosphoenolpyruvate synthase [Pseudomonadota bacterium]|nr:phosphoenolpyruvate synthase [Pseudomonadota bacterium]
MAPWIKWFEEIRLEDLPHVGGKTAALGEMYRALTPKGVRIPNGFAITSEAYRQFLKDNKLDAALKEILSGLDVNNVDDLRKRGRELRMAVIGGGFSPEMREAIWKAYEKMGRCDVAVRSSATAEDLPDASFAGQQETYLNVHDDRVLLESVRKCFASLFTDRAISYRTHRKINHLDVSLSVAVQKMVRSDLAVSGVMFSIDTESGFQNAVLINSSYGLGENIVQGAVNPDEIYVFKPTLREGFKPILKKELGSKEIKLIYDVGGEKLVKNVPVPPEDRKRFAISDEDALELARWACIVEDYFSEKHGRYVPMDMEWAKDGITGQLMLLQARPETIHSRQRVDVLNTYALVEQGDVIIKGRSVGEKIAQGRVRVINNSADLHQLQDGEVLVTDKTDPDWEPGMKRTSAIITNRGGRTCHAAIISRELGIPAVVGCGEATDVLKNGQYVTISCAQGEVGYVYEGKLKFKSEQTELLNLPKTKTKLMMNVANPDECFRLSLIPNDGVGLARMEFIINQFIKVHPLALLHFDNLRDPRVKGQITKLTAGYANKALYFVEKLSQAVGMIAAAFYPKDVIVRMSDFKTNEYANLVGGRDFEPKEENPMIGFRGASRYYHEKYRDGFALECQAMRKVIQEMGLKNLKLMIPFCRTVEEGKRVLEEMKMHGLERGKDGLEIYVMCELPSNVICAQEFAEIFDGFSIGSNDLTQLALGVDRDSEIVAPLFDERNPAVTRLIEMVIREAKAKGKKVGICGQAPSDYPEFARLLVKLGIDSMSLNPDVALKTRLIIAAAEKEFGVSAL